MLADEEFRTAQKSLSETGAAQPGPDTDTFTAEFRDGVHFNEKGLQAHGKLWAKCVIAHLDPICAADEAHSAPQNAGADVK